MTQNDSTALRIALAYHEAWTAHDFERAMTYVADDIVCHAPAGRLAGAESFRGFMGPFAGMLTGSSMIAAFGDETTALLMYNTGTLLVKDAPAAEFLTVEDGRITSMRIIFDRLPFEAARRSAAEAKVRQGESTSEEDSV